MPDIKFSQPSPEHHQLPTQTRHYLPREMSTHPSQIQHMYLGNKEYLNFTGAIILSVFVYLCCGCFFGLVAFILAMVGYSTATNGDDQTARPLLISSYVVSLIGVLLGLISIVIIIVVAIVVTAAGAKSV